MRPTRTLLIGTAIAALTLSALAGPVSAASSTKLAIVNGFPGKKVDVCVNGKEIKSGLKYGAKVFKTTSTPKATVKYFSRDPRTCKGTLIGKRTVFADDATVVLTKKKPQKVVVFNNAGLGFVNSANNTYLAIRDAADVGEVGFTVALESISPTPWFPSLDPIWTKGDEYAWAVDLGFGQYVMSIQVVLPASEYAYIAENFTAVTMGRRYEWIFVGSNSSNVRIVKIKRSVAVF